MESLHYFLSKIKAVFNESKDELMVSIIIVIVGISCFLLGKSSTGLQGKSPIEFDFSGVSASVSAPVNKNNLAGDTIQNNDGSRKIVASKNGTKYYFSGCSGVNRILDKNKVFFDSEEKAKQAGYTIASGCK